MAEISASVVMQLREQTGAGMMDCKKALAEAGGDTAKAIDILREKGLKKSAEKQARTANEGAVLSYVDDAKSFGVLVEINCETDFVAKNDGFVKFTTDVLDHLKNSKPASLEAFLNSSAPYSPGRKVSETAMDLTAKIGEKIEIKRISVIENKSGVVVSYIHPGSRLGVMLQMNIEGYLTSMQSDASALAYDLAMQTAAMNPTYVYRAQVSTELLEKESAILREQAKNEGKPEKVLENIIKGRLEKYFQEVCLTEQTFVKDSAKTVKDLIADLSKKLGKPVVIERFERFRIGG